jgi:hypothetical protein
LKTQRKTRTPAKELPIETYADARREYVSVYRAIRSGELSAGSGNAAVNALRGFVQSLEAEHGQTIHLNHSGAVGLSFAEECFDRVFGGSTQSASALPTGVVEGPIPDADMAEGPTGRGIDGDCG